MSRIITVKVSKGGVGKTTISSNLGYVLAQKNKKVLLIDLDSQSNLSKCFIKEFDSEKPTSSNLLGDEISWSQDYLYSVAENLDLIVSDVGLWEVSKFLESQGDFVRKLLDVLEKDFFKQYDYIILDLSPGVSDVLTQISLVASDLIICPMHFDTDSLNGIILTINDISDLADARVLEKELQYLVVPNRYDKRFEKDNKVIIDMVYENLDNEFIAEPIRENSHIKKARMMGITAIEYENDEKRKYEHKKAIEDFKKLADKVEKMLK